MEQNNTLTANGFVIDPLKSTVDAESPKQLTFTWTPPENHDVSLFFVLTDNFCHFLML